MAEAVSQTDWLIDYTPSRSLPLDQEALRVYEFAYQVGLETEGTGNSPVSFSTLLIALLMGDDETSRWFTKIASGIGPNREKIYAEKKTNAATIEAIPRLTG